MVAEQAEFSYVAESYVPQQPEVEGGDEVGGRGTPPFRRSRAMLHVRERPYQPPPLERALAQYWRDHGASLPPLQCDDGSRLRVV